MAYLRRSQSKSGDKVYTTYQIVKSYRTDEGKVRQRILLNLGPAHKFLEKDIDTLINGLLKIKGLTLSDLESDADGVKSFGQIWALMSLWKDLKVSQVIAREKRDTKVEFDLDKHIRSLVFNRLDDPSSKLKLLTWLETVYLPGIDREDIHYEYLLRAMDFLIEHKRKIENKMAGELLTFFDTKLKVCFYDLTSTYFEAEASLAEDDIRQKGYSRDHRADREQIMVGVVMTGQGIPLAHYTFAGNTGDSSTVPEVVQDIRERFRVKEVTLVADKGMVSGTNLEYLIENKQDFVLGESARKSKSARKVIRQAEEERQEKSPETESYVYATEEIKISKIPEPHPELEGKIKKREYQAQLRYVACYNAAMARKKYQTRTTRIAEALAEIENIRQRDKPPEDRYASIISYLRQKHLGRFFKVKLIPDKKEQRDRKEDEKGKKKDAKLKDEKRRDEKNEKQEEAKVEGENQEDEKKGEVQPEIIVEAIREEIAFEEQADGWFLMITTDRKTSREEIVTRYKDLKYVEHGFFELKHSLNLRPNFHWTEKRIRAHVMVCFMAFQLAVLFEKRLTKLKLSWEKAMGKLRRIHVIEWETNRGKRKGLVKTHTEQLEIFQAIGASKPTLNSL